MQWIWISGLVAAVLGYLLLQAATGSWRGAAVLLVAVPLSAVGGVLAAQLTGGVLTAGVLAALFSIVALTLRQALVLVRRAQSLRDDDVEATSAMRRALREKAPPVISVAAATGVFFLPAAVMGNGAGLELLQPFAITLIGGLVSALAVVLFVVPGLYPRLAGLEPSPLQPDESPVARESAVDEAPLEHAIPGPRHLSTRPHEEVQP
jgi:multidrug efflux pump subunit AcrB